MSRKRYRLSFVCDGVLMKITVKSAVKSVKNDRNICVVNIFIIFIIKYG